MRLDIKKDFVFYPEIDSKNFTKHIYHKKEFYDNRIKKETRDYDTICSTSKSENTGEYELLPQQKFLKNYISINTPYNSILIFHETGTGKTCAAISIVEGFIPYIKKYKKKVLVLVGKRIKDNFKKEIFDIDKSTQCTGNTYKQVLDLKNLTKLQKKKEINKIIKDRYRLVGPLAFANEVKKKINWDGNIETLTDGMISDIKKLYSNMAIVIDEVHNIKTSKKTSTIVPPVIMTVIKYGENNRLILMSATPMFDDVKEIVFILNLLLLNDGKKELKEEDIFYTDPGRDGKLKPNGEEILRKHMKGYISYLKSNPYSFPHRLYPEDITYTPNRKYTITGKKIQDNQKIKFMKLISCPMSKLQYKYYKDILSQTIHDEDYNKDSRLMKDSKITKTHLQYISSIVYHTKNNELIYGRKVFRKSDDGCGAFYVTKKKDRYTNNEYETYSYQKHMIMNYGTKKEKPFLDEENLKIYSNKFYTMLKLIKESKGIIFIYSQYIKMGGVIPFCLALEQNGYIPHVGGKSILNYPTKDSKYGKKRPLVCYYCGKYANDSIHKKGHVNYHKWGAARYILFTGSTNKGENMTSIIDNIINKPENKYGKDIKIIIGTRVISEGINFHNIRQIHVIEPWYNLSRLEQIIGRGIRHCKHLNLPPEERNVEIFQYVTTPYEKASKKDIETETIEEEYYRNAEDKDVKIKKVERIIKEVAVDCNLNINGNIHDSNKKVSLVNARGKKVIVDLSNKPFSRECDYMQNCKHKCDWKSPDRLDNKDINFDTYTIENAKDDMIKIVKLIKNIFKYDYAFKSDDIVKIIKKKFNIDEIYIYITLTNILKNKEVIYDKYQREGYLIYRGEYYIYQPNELMDETIPMKYREKPLTIKPSSIFITEDMYEDIENNKKNYNKSLSNKSLKNKNKNKIDNNMNKKIKKYKDVGDDIKIVTYMGLDRLTVDEHIYLIKGTLDKYFTNAKKMSEMDKIIFDYYNNHYVLDMYSKSKSKNIIGFGYEKTFLKKHKNKWCNFTHDEMRYVENAIKKNKEKIEKNKKDEKNFNIIVGDIKRVKNKVQFKIIDKTKYSGAVTLFDKQSKRSIITGQTCSFYKKADLVEIGKKIKLNIDYDSIKKNKLCDKIEYHIRNMDKKDKKKIWFLDLHM